MLYWEIRYKRTDSEEISSETAQSFLEAFGIFTSIVMHDESDWCEVVTLTKSGHPFGDGIPVLTYNNR